MILPAVVYDTNVYRGLDHDRLNRLVELERQRGVARYVDPVTLTELFAHLLDADDDRARASCRAAIGRAYQRSSGDGHCGLIRDSESRMVESITGLPLKRNDDYTDNPLRILFERVAKTPWDQTFDQEDETRLRIIKEHVPEQEARYVARMRGLQNTIAGIVADEPRNKQNETMANAQIKHETETRTRIAETLIQSSFAEVGRRIPEPLPAKLMEHTRRVAAGRIEHDHHILGKVAFTGANVDKPKIRNSLWDGLIAFNIGQSIGRWPLLLIAEDQVFMDVANSTGHPDRVAKLDAYERWLNCA